MDLAAKKKLRFAQTALYAVFLVCLAGCALTGPGETSGRDLLQSGDRIAHAQYLEANDSMVELLERGVVYSDESSRQIIDRILQRLFPGEENNPVRVTLARLPGENAYALPTGDIVMHQSMLAALASETQLAFVLAHEAAHVLLSHAWFSANHRTRRRLAAHLSDLVMLGSSHSYDYFANSVDAYGRQQELDADIYAARLLSEAGYDLKAAIGFFDVLRQYPMVYEAEAVQRTHPGIEERKQKLAAMIPILQPNVVASSLRPDESLALQAAKPARAEKGFTEHRVQTLDRSVRDKIAEHDLPGALVQLHELEQLTGETQVSDCLRGSLYTAIATDVAEAGRAMKELFQTPDTIDESDVVRQDADNNATTKEQRVEWSRASHMFLKQAEAIYQDRLRQTPDASCAASGLARVVKYLDEIPESLKQLPLGGVEVPAENRRQTTRVVQDHSNS